MWAKSFSKLMSKYKSTVDCFSIDTLEFSPSMYLTYSALNEPLSFFLL